MTSSPDSTCWRAFSTSSIITVVVVFLILFVDFLLVTMIDPILPDMLLRIDHSNNTETINSGGRYGFLIAAKGAIQFVCNPFVGLLATRFGYRKPMAIGTTILLISTILFAYGASYWQLLGTRLLQGVSSSVTAVTGLGLLASTFKGDENKRGQMIGIAFSGLSLGVTIGPLYGSLLYQFAGPAVPFLVLGGILGAVLVIELLTIRVETCDENKGDRSMAYILVMMLDPFILVIAGNLFLLNLGVAVVTAFLPIRLLELESAPTWKLGLVVFPTAFGYMMTSLLVPRTTRWVPRWLWGLIGMLVSAASLVGLIFSLSFETMLVSTSFLGLSLGMVSSSMQPLLATVVDLRHSSLYGNVYAISDMAVCLAMFLGPLLGGLVVYEFGFNWLAIGSAAFNLLFAPFSLLLRKIPSSSLKDYTSIDGESSDRSSGYSSTETSMDAQVCYQLL